MIPQLDLLLQLNLTFFYLQGWATTLEPSNLLYPVFAQLQVFLYPIF